MQKLEIIEFLKRFNCGGIITEDQFGQRFSQQQK